MPTRLEPGLKSPTAKGAARRAMLVEAAATFVARNGARGTSLAQIAEAAGVSQAGLIYHFHTKEELLHAALDLRDEAEAYLAWPEEENPGLAALDIIATAIGNWSEEPSHVGMHSVLVAENAAQRDSPMHARLTARYEAGVSQLAAALEQAQQAGEVRRDLDPRHKAMEVLAFVNGLETAWLMNPEMPAKEIARQWLADQKAALRPG
ncbi:TetR/AcrR family transcriptional regulator [Streptomyces sp. DSM 44915]|uniref:TetR/AcrR family transcriptional regulator n=1 Tax=Streptomyces chisholmiae TaxID=3075540 RepID=A0ABU2JQJ6_9ACTN|nr:TetR/AcrR family transcriptional regulator [Streptomyces sp. DSM 44915]MDT0267272.1 TetR/AcrR family transcriptional regulator [Streptomyces sp. DSM 44915]